MYYIYELVEDPDYHALKAKQRALALITAKSCLRKKSLDAADVICTYGCDASEKEVEAAILAETGYKTPWVCYTLDEFAEKLNADLPTFHEEDLPEEAMTPHDVPPAQPEVPPAPLAPVEEIVVVLRWRGRPKGPIVCPTCKKEFLTSADKYNHVRRGKGRYFFLNICITFFGFFFRNIFYPFSKILFWEVLFRKFQVPFSEIIIRFFRNSFSEITTSFSENAF